MTKCNIANLYRPISRKRYKIGSWLVCHGMCMRIVSQTVVIMWPTIRKILTVSVCKILGHIFVSMERSSEAR